MANREKVGNWYDVVELLCQMIFLAGLISGILFFGAEELEMDFRAAPLIYMLVTASAVSVVLCRLPVPGIWLGFLGAAGTLLALYFLWEPVSLGARFAVSQWIELFNTYFHQWKAGPELPELTGLASSVKLVLLQESTEIFLLYLAAALLFWSAFFLARMGSLVLPHTLMTLEMFFILTVGVVPKSYGPLWYVLFFLLWRCGGGSRGLRQGGRFSRLRWGKAPLAAAMFSAAAMGLALWLCAGVLMPKAESVLAGGSSGMKTWIRARLSEAADWDAVFGSSTRSGGVNGGDLSRQGNRVESGSVALSVTVTEVPSESLYLKAYVGSVYEGESWAALPAGLLEEDSGLQSEIVWNFPVRLLKRSGANFSDITVELYDAASQYLYVPYGAVLPGDSRYVSDQYLRRWSSKEDQYSYCTEFSAFEGADAEELSEEREYAEYVREHYLTVPDSDAWASWKASKEDASLTERIGRIQDYLADQADYTLSPGSLPEGEDFIEYFLFQNRKGYCTHFASAATILFRLWDIPARYVEGYIVSPEEFHENGDGTWTAWVTDRSAHAWTEIYRDGLTWYPVEATPPYWNAENLFHAETEPEEEDAPETDVPETEAAEEADAAPETKAPETPESKTEPSEEKKLDKPNFEIPWAAFGTAAAVLLTAGILAGKKVSGRKKRLLRIQEANRRLALLSLGEETERLLFGTEEPGAVLDAGFGPRAAELTEEIEEEEWEAFSRLVKRARFSPHPVKEEEYRSALVIYRKAKECLRKPLTGWKRFWREIP